MGESVKCKQCNNRTLDPSGLCYIHVNGAGRAAAGKNDLSVVPRFDATPKEVDPRAFVKSQGFVYPSQWEVSDHEYSHPAEQFNSISAGMVPVVADSLIGYRNDDGRVGLARSYETDVFGLGTTGSRNDNTPVLRAARNDDGYGEVDVVIDGDYGEEIVTLDEGDTIWMYSDNAATISNRNDQRYNGIEDHDYLLESMEDDLPFVRENGGDVTFTNKDGYAMTVEANQVRLGRDNRGNMRVSVTSLPVASSAETASSDMLRGDYYMDLETRYIADIRYRMDDKRPPRRTAGKERLA